MVEEITTDEKCPKCGKPMVHKSGKFGEFLGCSDYPNCKTTIKLDKEGNVLPPKPPAEPTGINVINASRESWSSGRAKKDRSLAATNFRNAGLL